MRKIILVVCILLSTNVFGTGSSSSGNMCQMLEIQAPPYWGISGTEVSTFINPCNVEYTKYSSDAGYYFLSFASGGEEFSIRILEWTDILDSLNHAYYSRKPCRLIQTNGSLSAFTVVNDSPMTFNACKILYVKPDDTGVYMQIRFKGSTVYLTIAEWDLIKPMLHIRTI